VNLRSYLKEIETYIEQNQNDQAIAHSLNILKKYPYLVDGLRLLGQAYLESKNYAESIDCFEKVVSIVPDDFVSHVAFSSIKEEDRDLDAAIFHMELAFDSQPSNIVVQEELKRLIGKRDGSAPEKISLTRGALVRMYAKGELYQQAINEINASLLLNPQRTDLKILLAEMHLKSNAAVQAAEICNQIVETYPFCLVPNQILYQIYLDNGLTENSKSVLDRLIAVNPYYSWIEPLSLSVEDVPDEKVDVEKIEYTSAFSSSSFVNLDRTSNGNLSTDVPLNGFTIEDTTSVSPELMDEILTQGGPFTSEDSDFDSEAIGAGPAPIEDSPETPLPDFMKQAGWQTSTNPDVGPPADYYESQEKEAQKTELPEWLKVKASEEFIVNSSISNVLSEMVPDANDPPSVNVPVVEEGNHSTQSNDNQPANSEVTMSDNNTPANESKDENSDWMAQFFDEAKSNQQEPESEKDLPEWLNNLGQEETDTKPEESKPDWLNTLDADIVEKKDDTQKSSDLDAILSDLASQSQDDTLTPIDISEGVESDVPNLDADDISLRLDDLTQIKPSFPPTDVPETNTPSATVGQQDIQSKDHVDYSMHSADVEEDDNQIPDWVKTVLSGPEKSEIPSTETDSPLTETENFVPEPSIVITEKELEVSDETGDEGAISASTSEELLGWLKEISPEQGVSDEDDDTGELFQNEFEPSASESVDEAIEGLAVSPSEADLVDSSVEVSSDIQEEEIPSEVSPLFEDAEETLPLSSISLSEEPLSELDSDSIPQNDVPEDLVSETISPVEIDTQEVAPIKIENAPDEFLQLVDLIKNNQFNDALNHHLLSSPSENDQLKILDAIQELKPERESDFEFMQFFGDVLAKANRFDEALEVYTRAEELLNQNQE